VSAAPDLLLRVSRERLPAVLTTAFVVGIPLVVLIVLGDRSGYEILRPMSIVVLGGLITSTALALFIMPTLCVRFIGTEAQRVPSVQAGDVAPAQNPSGA
jgi:Cu/Ag efflux pump CusA